MMNLIAEILALLGELSHNKEKDRSDSNGYPWTAIVLLILLIVFCISLFFIN